MDKMTGDKPSINLKLWITGLSLVVGFLCGFAVYNYFYFKPVARKQEQGVKEIIIKYDEILDYLGSAQLLIKNVNKNFPETYQKSIESLAKSDAEKIDKLLKSQRLELPEKLKEYIR